MRRQKPAGSPLRCSILLICRWDNCLALVALSSTGSTRKPSAKSSQDAESNHLVRHSISLAATDILSPINEMSKDVDADSLAGL